MRGLPGARPQRQAPNDTGDPTPPADLDASLPDTDEVVPDGASEESAVTELGDGSEGSTTASPVSYSRAAGDDKDDEDKPSPVSKASDDDEDDKPATVKSADSGNGNGDGDKEDDDKKD